MTDEQHYTFGDNDAAAERLELLARAFGPSSGAWLETLSLPRGLCVVDLGCGPGLTTALLAERLAPGRLCGIDQSERLIARAQGTPLATRARFLVHDVTREPFPVPPVDVLYARFLLTHLASPARVLTLWAHAAAPGGRLLLEEVAGLHSEHPAFRRYYEQVEALQAHYGQATYIGGQLHALARDTPWEIESKRLERIELSAHVMAQLHGLNLRTWALDAYAKTAFDQAELGQLARTFDAIVRGAAAPPVTCTMAQLALISRTYRP
jgi:trans-aconitate 2-methyltransferase